MGVSEREKEREGEREVGEGQRAREGERREEGGEERADTGRGYCTTVQQEAASAEIRHMRWGRWKGGAVWGTCGKGWAAVLNGFV